MTIDEYHNYLEKSFDAFCKIVIRNEAINLHKQIKARLEKEVPLSTLSDMQIYQLNYYDHYHPYCATYYVQDIPIKVQDSLLAKGLQYLPHTQRDVILLHYFLEYNDSDIARLLRVRSQTVANRRIAALKRLKEILEVLKDA